MKKEWLKVYKIFLYATTGQNGHFHKVVLTLPNVVKFDVEDVNIVLTLSIIAHNDWLMIYFRNNKYQVTLFPVLKNGFGKNNSQIFCRK